MQGFRGCHVTEREPRYEIVDPRGFALERDEIAYGRGGTGHTVTERHQFIERGRQQIDDARLGSVSFEQPPEAFEPYRISAARDAQRLVVGLRHDDVLADADERRAVGRLVEPRALRK